MCKLTTSFQPKSSDWQQVKKMASAKTLVLIMPEKEEEKKLI